MRIDDNDDADNDNTRIIVYNSGYQFLLLNVLIHWGFAFSFPYFSYLFLGQNTASSKAPSLVNNHPLSKILVPLCS